MIVKTPMKYAYYTHFAQAYGEGAYSACTYNDSTSCSSTGSGSSSSSSGSGGLANTGFDMLLIATLACLLIFIGLVVRIVRKKMAMSRRAEVLATTEDDDQPPQV